MNNVRSAIADGMRSRINILHSLAYAEVDREIVDEVDERIEKRLYSDLGFRVRVCEQLSKIFRIRRGLARWNW